ncbi:ATP-binding protein [cf. Phormidesmis sp. LEGE 11477]|uniref:ATP-binding protein n=1 Tax=cf. Phormidesmis sp. LEGE 11477 TaxID=1828680 RepID=UPI001882966C|nr:ATP-binding protein [cf. Phormidesmis sp. LEGE 11477]MBE9062113.1 CBS domain-containing protein [cf. Phormidesmis sp. LEGE 11477]
MCVASQVLSLIDLVMIPVSVTVSPETSIEEAIAQMSETQNSCVLIAQKQHPVGTFIDRDLVLSAALPQALLKEPISTVMIPTKATILATEIKDAFAIFQQMQQQHLYHLPVVDAAGKVIGAVTQHSLKQGLYPNDARLIAPKQKITEAGTGEAEVAKEEFTREENQKNSASGSTAEQILIEQLKGEFIAMVSHELRTPLTSIHGGIKLLSQGIVQSESAQGQYLLQVAAESSERLVRLVTDILELERLESRMALFQKRLINTRDLTKQVLELSDTLVKRKGIKLEIVDEGVQIMADSDRLTQVFTHLLDNAIRFSSTGSTVKITVALVASNREVRLDRETGLNTEEKIKDTFLRETSYESNTTELNTTELNTTKYSEAAALFTICDQGIGISPDQRYRIFERFVQGDRCYIQTSAETNAPIETTKAGSTGLGLSICQNIVEQHNGRIWVESQPGKGSCFYFTLPTKCEQSRRESRREQQNSHATVS